MSALTPRKLRDGSLEIEIWCESSYAVKCYRLTAEDVYDVTTRELRVRDMSTNELVDGWYTLEDLMFELQLADTQVWPSLENYAHCLDVVDDGGESWDLLDVLAALGVKLSGMEGDDT